MKHTNLILSALLIATGAYGAAGSTGGQGDHIVLVHDVEDAPKHSYEDIVYAFHNPTGDATLHVHDEIASRRKLTLQAAQGQFVSNLIELKENTLYVNGSRYLDLLSLRVGGGYPKRGTKDPQHECRPAVRFVVFQKYIGLFHEKASKSYSRTMSEEIQNLESPAAVLERILDSPESAVVIDLKVWLKAAFGDNQNKLPVGCVLKTDNYGHDKFVPVNQDELDRHNRRLATPRDQTVEEILGQNPFSLLFSRPAVLFNLLFGGDSDSDLEDLE